jgi:competence protein ComEA
MAVVPPRPTPSPGFLQSNLHRLGLWLRWCGPGRIAMFAVGALITAVGGLWLIVTPDPSARGEATTAEAMGYAPVTATEFTLLAPSPPQDTGSEGVSSVDTEETLFVHVVGAVVQPGVYSLLPTSRVIDALAAAGGPLETAQVDAMNLAALVNDGQRLVVPTEAQVRAGQYQVPQEHSSAGVGAPVANAGGRGSSEVRININLAGLEELTGLPGVGPAIAAAIIEDRVARGPFVRVEDLLRVRGIGPAKLEALRSRARV